MPLPLPNPSPAFVVTRISHVVFQVKDLDESRTFYEELIGLVVTESDAAAVYLRGVEETCHHSVVLHKTNDQPRFERVGFRVHEEDDLERTRSSPDEIKTLSSPKYHTKVERCGYRTMAAFHSSSARTCRRNRAKRSCSPHNGALRLRV
jgi:catechol 2,3-dioxygenase-like lactoylglutathione lyase family enzyme